MNLIASDQNRQPKSNDALWNHAQWLMATKNHIPGIKSIICDRILWHKNVFKYNSYRDAIKVGVSEPGKTYVWREQGYTSCSASCLGGVEELIVNCVREDTGKVVSPFLCSPETKPEARIRTCNDRPCPPRWNYSDYSPCSKSCGIGIREREVYFILCLTMKPSSLSWAFL